VADSRNLGDYPFEKFSGLIEVFGQVAEGKAFDELFESVVAVLEARRSEGAGGEALLERAYQRLEAGKTYEAIRLFGRAQERFIKREYRDELISALMGLCHAYEDAGLLWALATAHCSLLSAALHTIKKRGSLFA
jgi:hypothetical protein